MPACTLDSPRLGVFLHFDGVDVSYSVKTPPGCSRHGLTSSLTLLQNTTAGLWLPWLDEQLNTLAPYVSLLETFEFSLVLC